MCQESLITTLKKAIKHTEKNAGLIADFLCVIPAIINQC